MTRTLQLVKCFIGIGSLIHNRVNLLYMAFSYVYIDSLHTLMYIRDYLPMLGWSGYTLMNLGLIGNGEIGLDVTMVMRQVSLLTCRDDQY